MIAFAAAQRIWLACHVVDFRRSFDGLLAEAYLMGLDPFAGDVIVFVSRNKRTLKIILADSNGIWLIAKRFFLGTVPHHFYYLKSAKAISATDLHILLGGYRVDVLKKIAAWPKKGFDTVL